MSCGKCATPTDNGSAANNQSSPTPTTNGATSICGNEAVSLTGNVAVSTATGIRCDNDCDCSRVLPERSTILLVGNPNTGKSTLFNALTGARQKVCNAPGTTVEVFQGRWKALNAHLLDLPGTYSLLANSPDEQVVADTISGAPGALTDPARGGGIDLVLVLLDATAMSRSLYLLGQVAQTGRPVAAVVTMQDIAHNTGEATDIAALSQTLGIPVISVDARHKRNIEGVAEMVTEALATRPRVQGITPDAQAPGYNAVAAQVALGKIVKGELTPSQQIAELVGEKVQVKPKSVTPKEGDPPLDSSRAAQAALGQGDSEFKRAEQLFTWVNRVLEKAGNISQAAGKRSLSDRIDTVLLNPVLGTVIFFALMWLLFQVTGNWLGPVQDFFEHVFDGGPDDFPYVSVAMGASALLSALHIGGGAVESIINDGLLTGMGVAASFVPLMFVMFIAISIMEDSGYMARAAFLGDRLMRTVGLDGRVIMPLIVGFGCNLPALAAIRTLPNAKQRLVTTIIIPWASCTARLTIYLLIARIFFREWAGTAVFVMYVLSIVLLVLGALILKPFLTRTQAQAPLLLVLPPYQSPRVFTMIKSAWMRSMAFVRGAGKIIVIMTVVIWFLMSIPVAQPSAKELAKNSADITRAQTQVQSAEKALEKAKQGGKEDATTAAQDALNIARQEVPKQLEERYHFGDPTMAQEFSLYGKLAGGLAPVFAPAGFDDWHMAGALMTGFIAKETVISSVVASYNMDDAALGDAEEDGTPTEFLQTQIAKTLGATTGGGPGSGLAALAAFGFMVFVLAYTPCLATVAEQWRQIGAKWTLATVAAQLALAWLLAVLIFQIGRLFL